MVAWDGRGRETVGGGKRSRRGGTISVRRWVVDEWVGVAVTAENVR